MAGEDFGQELASIDFKDMIGGPLCAVVQAQSASAMASIGFIQSLGWDNTDPKAPKLRTVPFNYTKKVGNEEKTFALTIPLLALTNPPTLRIERVTIDFNAKLNSVQTTKSSDQLNVGVEASASGGFGPFSASLKASFAYQKNNEQGSEVNRSYSMQVHVEAVQDEIPAGLDRVLRMLESQMTDSEGAKPLPSLTGKASGKAISSPGE